MIESSWNVMVHGDAWEGKWRGNWWMEWVASTLTLPRNVVYPTLLSLMRTTRLPVVDWTDGPADLNGLVRFSKRQNLVSVRVPSHFNWPLHRCVIKSVVMWLHILVGPCWCMYVALFGSVTLASTNNALPDDGVTAPKHVGAILM